MYFLRYSNSKKALLTPLAASIVQPAISSVVKGIVGRGVRRAEENLWMKIMKMDENF